jgi:uncharacterized membrane protein
MTSLSKVPPPQVSFTAVPETFTAADVAAQTVKTATSSQFVTSLSTTLLGSLNLKTTALGFSVGIGPAVTQPLSLALQTVAPSMDSVLYSLLTAFGLGIGQADTWTGINCGSPVLVN